MYPENTNEMATTDNIIADLEIFFNIIDYPEKKTLTSSSKISLS